MIALKGANRDFYNLFTAPEPSPTRTLKRSWRKSVQITCNTSSAYHVQRVCHVVRRDSSAIKFDIAFISALFYWLTPLTFFFFFCVPGHARFSVRWVRRSPQSAAVSQPVPKASCGPPPDWTMSGVSSHRRWGRIAGCGWGFEDPCRMDIRLSGKFTVCGGGRGVDSVQFSV